MKQVSVHPSNADGLFPSGDQLAARDPLLPPVRRRRLCDANGRRTNIDKGNRDPERDQAEIRRILRPERSPTRSLIFEELSRLIFDGAVAGQSRSSYITWLRHAERFLAGRDYDAFDEAEMIRFLEHVVKRRGPNGCSAMTLQNQFRAVNRFLRLGRLPDHSQSVPVLQKLAELSAPLETKRVRTLRPLVFGWSTGSLPVVRLLAVKPRSRAELRVSAAIAIASSAPCTLENLVTARWRDLEPGTFDGAPAVLLRSKYARREMRWPLRAAAVGFLRALWLSEPMAQNRQFMDTQDEGWIFSSYKTVGDHLTAASIAAGVRARVEEVWNQIHPGRPIQFDFGAFERGIIHDLFAAGMKPPAIANYLGRTTADRLREGFDQGKMFRRAPVPRSRRHG